MTHQPQLDGDRYTCPDCAWVAVLASDGRLIQTSAGDAGHDHLGQARAQLAQGNEHAARIMARLRDHYERGTTLPLRDTATVPPAQATRPATLTVKQLQRLYRAVIGEWR